MPKTAETKWREYSVSTRLNFVLYVLMALALVAIAWPLARELYATFVALRDILQ
jgi:hypothetical protein